MALPCMSCTSRMWQWCIFFRNCITVIKSWGHTELDNLAAMRKFHTVQYMQLGCTGARGAQPRALCELEHRAGLLSALFPQLHIWAKYYGGNSAPHLESFLHPLNHCTSKSKPVKSWIVHVNCHQFLFCCCYEQHLFSLIWQWITLWCFLVLIINLWPSLLITRYQLLLPTSPSARPWELMVQATFSIFPFRPFCMHYRLSATEEMYDFTQSVWLIVLF